MSEFEFYLAVLQALEEIGARYMVVGAYGASAYGVSRATHDVDMIVDLLEDKVVAISRSAGSLTYLANFILVGSMNSCPCGYASDPEKECTCSVSMIKSYQKRISGPLLDRIDIHVAEAIKYLTPFASRLAIAHAFSKQSQ